MQIVIAGAGSVGRSIARELISHGHEVTLVDRSAEAMRIASVPEADWQLADACDIDALERAGPRPATSLWPPPGTTKPTWSSLCWPRPSTGAPHGCAHQQSQERMALR